MNNNSPMCLVVSLSVFVSLSLSLCSLYRLWRAFKSVSGPAVRRASVPESVNGREEWAGDERAISVGGAVGSAVGWASWRTGGSVSGRPGGWAGGQRAGWRMG